MPIPSDEKLSIREILHPVHIKRRSIEISPGSKLKHCFLVKHSCVPLVKTFFLHGGLEEEIDYMTVIEHYVEKDRVIGLQSS